MIPNVYYSKEITKEKVLELFKLLNINPTGRIAIKVHSGEVSNQNFIKPEFWKPICDYLKGTIVECNTAYEGGRNTTEKHLKTLKLHEWTKYFNVDILDSIQPDLILDIPNGKIIKKNYVGKNLENYDFLLVLSHFKGHPMGGYGGALKQLSIGLASSYGKAYIHGAGDVTKLWTADHDKFLESMADSASSIMKMFEGKAAFINVLCNMSVDCDCCEVAEDPCIPDMGILSSLDPIAIDQASINIVFNSNSEGLDHFKERVLSRNGLLTIKASEKLGFGSSKYNLITVK